MNSQIFQTLSQIEKIGKPVVLCTIIETHGSTPRHEGSKMLVFPDGKILGTIGGGEVEQRVIHTALEALEERKPRRVKYSMVDPEKGDPGVCGGQLEIFVEPVLPKNRLVVIGAGHVGREVAFLGRWLGFYVVLFDDRPEFYQAESVPNADQYLSGDIENFLNETIFDFWTYVVLTTRNVEMDIDILPEVLKNDTAYIGVIGSKKRWETTKKSLVKMGLPEEQLNRIYSPIGLDLNAETPREIALSILSEIIMVQRNDLKTQTNSLSKSSIGK